MDEKEGWGLTEEEKRERVRKLNQEKDKKGATRGGRSSGQGVKLLYIRDFLYANATKEHPQNANRIQDFLMTIPVPFGTRQSPQTPPPKVCETVHSL